MEEMKKVILKTISRHMKASKFTKTSQQRFIKEKPCSIKLVGFYDENTGLVDKRREVNIFHLDFSKALDTSVIKKNDEVWDEQTKSEVG